MSRNFDLIQEIEQERQFITTPDHPPASTFRSAVKENGSQPDGNSEDRQITRLVQNVFLSGGELAPRKVVFCGVDEESGSSSVCARVGRILASQSPKSVCVVDANLRLARISRILGVAATIPISKETSSSPERCSHAGGNLWLAGTEHLAGVRGHPLENVEVEQRLAHLSNSFDYLLIDAPGLGVCSDAALLGKIADATILVIEAGLTRRTSAVAAKAILDAAGVPLFGTVLLNWTLPIPETLFNRL
jgi:Mrp family chromosome partitioning ATPase